MFDVDPYFDWIVLASALVDFAVGLAATVVRRPVEWTTGPRVTFLRMLGAVAVTTVVFVVKAAFLIAMGVHVFGVLRLIYVDLVIVIPAIGAFLIWADRAWDWPYGPFMPWSVRNLALASLLLPFVGYYATCVEPFRLRVEVTRVPIATGRAGRGDVADRRPERHPDPPRHSLRASGDRHPHGPGAGPDPHAGRRLPRGATPTSNASGRQPQRLWPSSGGPREGSISCRATSTRAPGRIARLVEGTGITPLVDEMHLVDRGGFRLRIGGIELDYTNPGARRLIERLERGPVSDEEVCILLAHRPDVVEELRPSSRVDLVVAGHTHGGQVVVPGFGPLITLSGVPMASGCGGLHEMNGNRIYVSRASARSPSRARPRAPTLLPAGLSILELGRDASGVASLFGDRPIFGFMF